MSWIWKFELSTRLFWEKYKWNVFGNQKLKHSQPLDHIHVPVCLQWHVQPSLSRNILNSYFISNFTISYYKIIIFKHLEFIFHSLSVFIILAGQTLRLPCNTQFDLQKQNNSDFFFYLFMAACFTWLPHSQAESIMITIILWHIFQGPIKFCKCPLVYVNMVYSSSRDMSSICHNLFESHFLQASCHIVVLSCMSNSMNWKFTHSRTDT